MKYQTEYLQKCHEVTEGRFIYDESKYTDCRSKIPIKCIEHNLWFEQIPSSNKRGFEGCPECLKRKLHYAKEDFVKKAKERHGNKYSYENVEYINSVTHVNVTCPNHGDFKVQPKNHLYSDGCRQCGYKRSNLEDFIKKAKEIHGDKYDYTKSVFTGYNKKINILCKHHGEFNQNANNHTQGSGCPSCKMSKGEERITEILKNAGIKYEQQKKFKGCVNKISLRFDFFLPDLNTVIEFHGKQHYMAVDYFGGEEGFRLRKKRDQIKKNWCEKNNITYIEIPYNCNIEAKLVNSLNLT